MIALRHLAWDPFTAGVHKDAVQPGVEPEPVAGHEDLAAASPRQHGLIEVKPLIDWGLRAGRPGPRGVGEAQPRSTPDANGDALPQRATKAKGR